MSMIRPSRILRWFKRMRTRPNYITDLWNRYDNWLRTKEYL